MIPPVKWFIITSTLTSQLLARTKAREVLCANDAWSEKHRGSKGLKVESIMKRLLWRSWERLGWWGGERTLEDKREEERRGEREHRGKERKLNEKQVIWGTGKIPTERNGEKKGENWRNEKTTKRKGNKMKSREWNKWEKERGKKVWNEMKEKRRGNWIKGERKKTNQKAGME